MGVLARPDVQTSGGAVRPVDARLAPTGAERRPNRYEHGGTCATRAGSGKIEKKRYNFRGGDMLK